MARQTGIMLPILLNVAKIENADKKDDDFKIVNILRDGFVWRDKVLRPQEVVIKKFSS